MTPRDTNDGGGTIAPSGFRQLETPGPSSGVGLDDQLVAEHAQGGLDTGYGGAMARVEHAAHGLLVDTEHLGEGHTGQAVFGESSANAALAAATAGTAA